MMVSKDEVAVREFNLFYECLNLFQKEWVDGYRDILKEELRGV